MTSKNTPDSFVLPKHSRSFARRISAALSNLLSSVHDGNVTWKKRRLKRIKTWEKKSIGWEEETLKAFIQHSSDSIIVVDPQGAICEWNSASEILSGFAASEVMNQPAWEIFHRMSLPKYRTSKKLEYFEKLIRRELRTGVGPNLGKINKVTLISKFGLPLNIRQFAFPVQIDKRNFIVCVSRDVKAIDYQRMKQQLTESKKRLHIIMDSASVGVFIIDSSFTFLYVNDETCRIVGYTRKEIMRQNLMAFMSEDNRSFLTEHLLLEQGGEPFPNHFEAKITRKDGKVRQVEMTVTVFKDEQEKPFSVGQLLDITEREQAEEKINQRNRELETLAKLTAAMRQAQKRAEIYSVVLQQSVEILDAGGAALALCEPSCDEPHIELGLLAWKDWNDSFPKADQEITRQVIATGKVYRNDSMQNFGVGSPVLDVGYRICVPMIASRKPIGALWIGRSHPITDSNLRSLNAIADLAANAIHRQTLHENLLVQLENLRQAQARLLQSEKLAAIGLLVSGVAHELNNPLTSVILYSQLVQQETQDPAIQQNMAKVISEAMRAGKIVHGLLDFSRQRPIKREKVQINSILVASLDMVSYEMSSRNIKLDLLFSQDLPPIMADPLQLQQVFINLLQNAWQAIETVHTEGNLEISTEVGVPKFSTSPPWGEKIIRIAIKDDGPGISDENLNRIFDPFFTTKPEGEGTGLGLSVCHGIIEEHEGHIWAESILGKETTFFIELPVTPVYETEIHEDAASYSQSGKANAGKILIIDDEPNVKDVLAQALQRWGYQVDTVSNGVDGLGLLAQASYSHILCDIRMPGFNGLEFYQHVKAEVPTLAKRIIFITGDTANKVTRKFIEENKVKVLSKPFELTDLLHIIQDAEKYPDNKS